ncbi:STAS domain-containing protein [Pontibacter roseus]|uniref:STAS domain-containing protein n=1 Tax=Pontibacter roseus TaxID=336989 RepID=UPI00035C8E1C|nr:STAS domain-containing protein [Pontibacter roseus]
MDITIQTYNGLTVVVAQGLLSESTFSEVNEKVRNAPTENTKQVWLDCTHLHRVQLTQTCFSSFISELLQLRRQGIEVVLFGVSGHTQHLLRLLHLEKMFRQVPTLEDAYLLINQPQGNSEIEVSGPNQNLAVA